jgi:hypothetical protein
LLPITLNNQSLYLLDWLWIPDAIFWKNTDWVAEWVIGDQPDFNGLFDYKVALIIIVIFVIHGISAPNGSFSLETHLHKNATKHFARDVFPFALPAIIYWLGCGGRGD